MTDHSTDDVRAHGGLHGALAEIRAAEFTDGPQRGIRYLDVRTGGGLRFDVLIDRGLDLGAAEFEGRSFAWRSPTGLRHPALVEVGDDFGRLRAMSGLLVTGGLDHVFTPREVDASGYRHAQRATLRHGLHGRVADLVAEHVTWGLSVDGPAPQIWIEGDVRQVALFGEHLTLNRRIETPIGGSSIRLVDRVRNEGSLPQDHRLLYHVNIGWPALTEGTRFEVDGEGAELLTPVEYGTSGRMPAPTPGAEEVAAVHRLSGTRRASAITPASAFRLDVVPDASLPYLVEWIHARATEYGAALEPSTHDPRALDAPGTSLAPGEERRYSLTLAVGSA